MIYSTEPSPEAIAAAVLSAAILNQTKGEIEMLGRAREILAAITNPSPRLRSVPVTESGDYSQAIEELKRDLRAKPQSVELHCLLGCTYAHAGMLDDAEVEFRAAVRIQPDSCDAHRLLALVAMEKARGQK